jgi:hypothetical protein
MNSGEQFRRELAREMLGGNTHPINFRALGSCDCGCGAPARIEIQAGEVRFSICDAVQIDMLIDMLKEGRERLWGPRPKGGGPCQPIGH